MSDRLRSTTVFIVALSPECFCLLSLSRFAYSNEARSVPESINRRFSFRLLNTVTGPHRAAPGPRRICQESKNLYRTTRKRRRYAGGLRYREIVSGLQRSSPFFLSPFAPRYSRDASYPGIERTGRGADRGSSSSSSCVTGRTHHRSPVGPPTVPVSVRTDCQLQRQRELPATRRTEQPSSFPYSSVGVTNFSPGWLPASSILIKPALRKPSFPEGSPRHANFFAPVPRLQPLVAEKSLPIFDRFQPPIRAEFPGKSSGFARANRG